MRVLYTLLIFLVCYTQANSQYIELGVLGGVSKYFGDLTPANGDLEIHGAYGAFLRYNFNKRLAINLTMQGGGLSGSDANSTDFVRQKRNLSFKSSFMETGLHAELNILPFVPGDKTKSLTPFISAGVGFFYFNPKAKLGNTWHTLNLLGTEGQGLNAYPDKAKYSLLQVSFPLGMGIRYAINEKASFGLECRYRFAMTDYVDDVGGTYADPLLIADKYGTVAAALSNRTSEITAQPSDYLTGTPRANTDGRNDGYMIFNLTFSYCFYDLFPFHQNETRSVAPRRRIKDKDEPTKWF